MKFLLVLVVVLIGFYVWRSSRAQRATPPRDAAAAPPGVVEMVPCAQCGVHCARDEAVVGKAGMYCTTQHRSLSES